MYYRSQYSANTVPSQSSGRRRGGGEYRRRRRWGEKGAGARCQGQGQPRRGGGFAFGHRRLVVGGYRILGLQRVHGRGASRGRRDEGLPVV